MGAGRIRHTLLALLLWLSLTSCVGSSASPTPTVITATPPIAGLVAAEPSATQPPVPEAPTPTIAVPAAPTTTATPALSPTAAPAPTTTAIPRPPDRNPLELAARMRSNPSPASTPQASPSYVIGDRHSFWVLDQGTKTYGKVTARLAYITDHVYMYVADGVEVEDSRLKTSADFFEANTYPTLRENFGSEWTPGIDNDVRLTILNARVPGIGGYFSSGDEVPKSVNQYSNEREMFYINVEAFEPGTAAYDATLAHEFTHMIQHNVVRGGETWVNEGTAELAVKSIGLREGFAKYYLDNPDLQLTGWAESPTQTVPHYGAAFLFFDYFAQHYGGYEAVGRLLAEDGRDISSFDAHVARRNLDVGFVEIFRDWIVANYLNDSTVGDGRYGYAEQGIRARTESVNRLPARVSGEVHQFGVDYYEVANARGDLTVSFSGTPDVRLAPLDAYGGQAQWWSNRGDSINSRLTREFDLSSVKSATLQFSLWHDVEESYDYGFVAASTDGGKTWQTLPGKHTTASNPNGGNFGHGYTGDSGGGQRPRWVPEEIDLTPFAGSKVLLRFKYVTDDAFNANGLGIDDIGIPEINFHDDAESESGWYAEGWVRTTNRVPQDYTVQVITIGRTTEVRDLPLAPDRTGSLLVRDVGPNREIERIVIAIAATTPLTTGVTSYGLDITSTE